MQESAAGHEYRVTGEGFWQIHKDAPDTLVDAVTGYLSNGGYLQPGAAVADLYAGAGLFTAPLADAVGVTGSVLSVEGAPGTSRDARKNLHGEARWKSFRDVLSGSCTNAPAASTRWCWIHPPAPEPARLWSSN